VEVSPIFKKIFLFLWIFLFSAKMTLPTAFFAECILPSVAFDKTFVEYIIDFTECKAKESGRLQITNFVPACMQFFPIFHGAHR